MYARYFFKQNHFVFMPLFRYIIFPIFLFFRSNLSFLILFSNNIVFWTSSFFVLRLWLRIQLWKQSPTMYVGFLSFLFYFIDTKFSITVITFSKNRAFLFSLLFFSTAIKNVFFSFIHDCFFFNLFCLYTGILKRLVRAHFTLAYPKFSNNCRR